MCAAQDKCKVWYLKNHSLVGQDLTLGEGLGLRMLMSATPCKQNPASCHGAKMAADHATSIAATHFGDYELRMRAPHALNGTGGTCDKGIYAYFTAGYANKNGQWRAPHASRGLSSFRGNPFESEPRSDRRSTNRRLRVDLPRPNRRDLLLEEEKAELSFCLLTGKWNEMNFVSRSAGRRLHACRVMRRVPFLLESPTKRMKDKSLVRCR